MGKLTDVTIRNAKPKDKPYRIADGDGLSIQINTSGGKLWRYRYRYDGKEQTIGLGRYPVVSLSDARKKALDARALLDEGKNPSREKKAEKLRNSVKGENTFEAIARRWLEMKSQKLNPKYAKQVLARMEQHVFPKIGALPIDDITIPDVVMVVEAMGEHGIIETAKRMKQTIGQVFRYAAQRGLCQHNPAADLRDILPTTEVKHHAAVPLDELPQLIRDIEGRKKDFTYYAMKLFMLTFLRTNEIIAAKWEEIDWDREEWHVPKERMKVRRPHMVPLSKQSMKLLRELQERTGNKPFIFFSAASKSQHISNGTVLMGLRRMGYQGRMTGHGFRTVASTALNEKGYSPDVIERQLAHAEPDRIRDAYNRAEYRLERKKMMQEWADWLEEVGRGQDNVLHIKHGSAQAQS